MEQRLGGGKGGYYGDILGKSDLGRGVGAAQKVQDDQEIRGAGVEGVRGEM